VVVIKRVIERNVGAKNEKNPKERLKKKKKRCAETTAQKGEKGKVQKRTQRRPEQDTTLKAKQRDKNPRKKGVPSSRSNDCLPKTRRSGGPGKQKNHRQR